jgi:hypothetical protein
MRLAKFIIENLETILIEWEAFAGSLLTAGQEMTALALRDHARQILLAIAEDIETNQTELEQRYKSKGFVPIAMHGGTLAAKSSDQEGTVFSAHLPRTPPGAGARPSVGP